MSAILIRWIVGAVVSAGALGSVLLWLNISSFNRGHAAGVAETTERMKKAIAEMQRTASQTQHEWQRKTPGEKTAELQKRCVAACQQELKCEATCKQ